MTEILENKLKQVLETYPYLHRKKFPLNNCFPVILEGYLVTRQECINFKIRSESDAENLSFYARILIPKNFIFNGIEVYDLYKKIDKISAKI